jgi:hypothetical protein
MHNICLTSLELRTVIAALEAVSPVGGGSATNTLKMKLQRVTSWEPADDVYEQYVSSLEESAHRNFIAEENIRDERMAPKQP